MIPTISFQTSARFGLWLWVPTVLFTVSRQTILLEFIQGIVLWAVLILVPIGLWLIQSLKQDQNRLLDSIKPLILAAGLLSAVSFALPPGAAAGILQFPWWLVTGVVAFSGLKDFLKNPFASRWQTSLAVAQGYLFVGGCWLLADRLGMNVLHFSQEIILLTGMHFHYAGFTTTLLAALVGRQFQQTGRMNSAQIHWGYWLVTLGVTVATPIIAIGITAVPLLEVIGAVFLAVSLMVMGLLMGLEIAPQFKQPAKTFLWISAGTSFFSMTMAILYGFSEFYELKAIEIPFMVITHGLANTMGFATCGLMAFYLSRNTQAGESLQS
ncbi:MAG: YndJ family protein [Vampirovibrio sp.]|nr:YndJ family protein [Vampirovibrio sp.]